jgi:hypothetical protein
MADDEWTQTELKIPYTQARPSLFTVLQDELLYDL